MHHALYIQEILLRIFNYCTHGVMPSRFPDINFPDSVNEHFYETARLNRLARTCRAFKEPALDMVWAELGNLTPLVRCLPRESWTIKSGVCSLKKPLEQTEWDTILGYACRVRALDLYGSFGLAPDCIRALSKPPASTEFIFPNLRTVKLREPKATTTPLMRHLANPTVKDISFGSSDILGAAIDAFGKACPSVTDLTVPRGSDSDAISGLIRCWQNLRSLHCSDVGLNVDAVSQLSRLRNLHYMTFRVHDALVNQCHATSTSTLTFPALRHAYLDSQHLTSIWKLLRHFRLPVIHRLDIRASNCPTAPDLMSFVVALQEACTSTSLNTFVFQAGLFIAHFVSTRNSPQYYITINHFRPLTVFVNLRIISFQIPCGMDLNEHELLTLASSWPRLETFEVAQGYVCTPSSALTPNGFLKLLERCRSLRVLDFMLDTRGYSSADIPQGHPWRGLSMPRGAFINVLHAPIEEASVEALGVFFHVAPYPNFTLQSYLDRVCFGPKKLRILYRERWKRVYELARDLWEKRRDLRRAIEMRSSQQCSQ